MKNEDVANAWANNRTASTKNMKTDGSNLYSYNLLIGISKGGEKILFNYTSKGGYFESQTTSMHICHGRRVASVVVCPSEKKK